MTNLGLIKAQTMRREKSVKRESTDRLAKSNNNKNVLQQRLSSFCACANLKEEKFFGQRFCCCAREKVKKLQIDDKHAKKERHRTKIWYFCVLRMRSFQSKDSLDRDVMSIFVRELGPKNKKKNFYFYCEENRKTTLPLLHLNAVFTAITNIYGQRDGMWE